MPADADGAFCCLALLRCPDRLKQILAVLPASRREALRAALEPLSGVAEADLKHRLAELCARAARARRDGIEARLGVPLDSLPAALRRWAVMRA